MSVGVSLTVSDIPAHVDGLLGFDFDEDFLKLPYAISVSIGE